MTSTAFDPPGGDAASQAPKPGRSVRRSGARRSRPIDRGRILAVAGVGAAVIGGFAGAMTLLSGLAAPPPRPVIAINTRAAEWPDLRDGVPALARPDAAKPRAAAAEWIKPPPAAPAAPASLRTALDPVPSAVPSAATVKRAGALPQIENAAMVAPLREAALVVQPRSAPLVRPLASETVRARTAAASAFTALEPEDATASVAEPVRETATREPVKPRTKVSAVRPARPTAAAPVAANAAAEPESDDTEVLGMKIPSLASAGRKLRAAFGGGETANAATE